MEAQIQNARDKGNRWFIIFVVTAIVTLILGFLSIKAGLGKGNVVLLCAIPFIGILASLVTFAISMSNFSLVDELETQERFHIHLLADRPRKGEQG